MAQGPSKALDPRFVKRTLFQFFIAGALFVAWQLANVFLLVFGAIVVAVLLRSIANPIRDRTPLSNGAALAAAGLLILAIIAGASWLFGSLLVAQVADLAGRLPHSMAELRRQVATWPFGDQITARLSDTQDLNMKFQGLAGQVGGYAISVAGATTSLLLVIFAGVFLAMNPAQTKRGAVALLPAAAREKTAEAIEASGEALRRWLLGMLADMLCVGVLTGVGAALLGLPSPFALAAIAAVTDFVPIVGPIVSIIPGVLVAAPEGPKMMLWTLLMYLAVQQLEGNLIYPFIQRRAVDLPPVLSLLAVVGFGVLLGPLGVVLATPMLVVLYTMIRQLYVRDTLGQQLSAP